MSRLAAIVRYCVIGLVFFLGTLVANWVLGAPPLLYEGEQYHNRPAYYLQDIVVYDGDTITATIRVPYMDTVMLMTNQKIRISTIGGRYYDAYELRGADATKGLAAKNELEGLLKLGIVRFKYVSREKYGRLLGPLSVQLHKNVQGQGIPDVAELMQFRGHDAKLKLVGGKVVPIMP